jgi:F-type H+-transporting ATPase subunit a
MTSFVPFTLGADDPLGHVVNAASIVNHDGYWLWSDNQGALVLSGLIIILVGLFAASRIRTGPQKDGANAYIPRGKFAHMIEVLCVYLREEVIRPLLHDRTDRFTPLLLTFFFFILVNNLIGLTPIRDLFHALHLPSGYIGGTATQNIWVTGTLAVLAALLFNVAAIARLGPVGFVQHMTGGLPWYMFPIALLLLVIEAAGQFIIKPFALALRLFANMTAGHVLIASILGFAGVAIASMTSGGGYGANGAITIVSVLAATAMMFLELFVAFLQAFVFMFLTTIFISLMDHHDEHGHEHEHGHAHGHEHAHA